MILPLLALSLALAIGAAPDLNAAGRASAAARLARVEADACLATCPALPAQPDSDWLRSPEGRKANACPMACRLDQPAAALFRALAELATAAKPDPDAAIVKAAGKDGPELLRRLRAALREAEGQRFPPLCARARAAQRPADEAIYLECIGRAPGVHDGLAAPDSTRAPRCATLFAERDLEWLKRCGALEAKTDVDACVEAPARHGVAGGNARARCEADAVGRLAAALAPHPRT